MSSAAYTLTTEVHDAASLVVLSFEGEESINAPYLFRITVGCALGYGGLVALERELLGQRATFGMRHHRDSLRSIHGVITSVAVLDVEDERRARVIVELRPGLSLLGLRTQSRIFEGMTVSEIVADVLNEWSLPHEFGVESREAARTYCTQYEETDLAFVERLLAEAGHVLYFAQEPLDAERGTGREVVKVIDQPYFYRPIVEGAEAVPPVEYLARADSSEPHVRAFSLAQTLRPRSVELSDFDFRKPRLAVRSSATVEVGPMPAVGRAGLDSIHHADRPELGVGDGQTRLDAEHARVVLDAERRDAVVGRGESRCRALACGHVFTLRGHPIDVLNAGYVVTSVRHRGATPELGGDSLYDNDFECAPLDVLVRPPPPMRNRRQTVETATVVGPQGEEIHTDALGRIKVRFHWDRRGQTDEQGSCWLRVAQGWAGTGWGLQMIPRVGMEVLVTFLGGNVDRPVVTGCLYNGTHPLPFEPPASATRTGIRTQSLGGGGFNELSFEDTAGKEQIYLYAERDWVEVVQRDHAMEIEGEQRVVVGGKSDEQYAARVTAVSGGDKRAVGGDEAVEVSGASVRSVGGDGSLVVGGDSSTRVVGRERHEVQGSSEAFHLEDATTRILGHHVLVVGQHDARRSSVIHVEGTSSIHSTGLGALTSDKKLSFGVGDSRIVVSETGIELHAPTVRIEGGAIELLGETVATDAKERVLTKSKTIMQESEGAFLGLARVAKLSGETVKLNCAPDPTDGLEPSQPKRPTVIELVDEKGVPLAGRRFVLRLEDGSERSGTTDNEGRAEFALEQGGDVLFLDVDQPRRG